MDEIPASEFDFRDFDVREFVQRYRKRLPLPQLQKGLRAHHAATRQELVELINEKYADFVHLSTRMQGVERAVKPLRPPLMESAELTQGLRSKLGALLEQAEETHGALAGVRRRKESLVTYIENARLLDRAQATAEQRWANPQESDDLLREHVAQENVARDLRRLRHNLACEPGGARPQLAGARVAEATGTAEAEKGEAASSETRGLEQPGQEDSAECQALLHEAVEFESGFATRLQQRLRRLVETFKQSWSGPQAGANPEELPSRMELLALAHLARALVTIGHASMVEEVLADILVKKVLEEAAAVCTTNTEGGSATVSIGTGALNLGPFFEKLRSSLLAEDAYIIWFSRCFSGSTGTRVLPDVAGDGDGDVALDNALLAVPGLRIISNAAVAPVLKYVQQVWPNVFMPAFPDSFAANYLHATQFISAAENLMDDAERVAFSSNAALLEFRRKWKTQVYASLRAKEAAQQVEVTAAKSRTALAQGGPPPSTPPFLAAGIGFWFEVSAELAVALQRVWSEGWFLMPLYLKSLQLVLDLVARYGQALRALKGVEAGLDAAPGAGWEASTSPPRWASTSRPARMARAAADGLALLQLLGWTEGEGQRASAGLPPGALLAKEALRRLPQPPSSPSSASQTENEKMERASQVLQMLFEGACARLKPVLAELDAALLQPVLAQATTQFAAVRSIPAFYRMLNKPVPTRASPYVESAMRPLQALQELALTIAPAGAVAAWLQLAVDAAAGEFSAQALQLLESTHQQEASLKRLAGRGTSGDSKVSDLEKIHIQLCLDVETFVSLSKDLGVDTAKAASVVKLEEVTAPVRSALEAHRQPAA